MARASPAVDDSRSARHRDVRHLRRQAGQGAGVARGKRTSRREGVHRTGGLQGALRLPRRRRRIQLHAVEPPRAGRPLRAPRRQAFVRRGPLGDDRRRMLGVRRDGGKDAAALHAARELLLRRGRAAGAFDVQEGRAGNAHTRRMRICPRQAHRDIRRRIPGPLAPQVERGTRGQPVSDARAVHRMPVLRRQPRRPARLPGVR